MPQNTWINNALLIPEGTDYKVDSCGRIVIPSHLRAKFDITVGDQMEYYTTFVDGKWVMCVTKKPPEVASTPVDSEEKTEEGVEKDA